MTNALDPKFKRMLTQEGFIALYWEEVCIRAADPSVTREDVFNDLNRYFESYAGFSRYMDYDCFRKILQRSRKAKK